MRNIDSGGTETIRQRIDSFAAARATTARTLKAADRKELIIKLRKEGLLNFRKSMDTVAQQGVLEILCHSSNIQSKRNDTCPSPSISTKHLKPSSPARH
ncbi:helix-turn-helix domain-containing protein [Salmonella enterica]